MPNRDLLIAILHEDFLAFVERAFAEVEPRVTLAVEDYIRLLAHELTALAAGDTKRLILSLPPRHLKSLLTSVFLPAWMLGRDPRLRFIIVSHQMDLATLFSRLISANYCERLVRRSISAHATQLRSQHGVRVHHDGRGERPGNLHQRRRHRPRRRRHHRG